MEDTYRSQFRLPHPLYEKLKAAAEAAGRSVNAELVHRLAGTLDSGTNAPTGLSSATEAQLLQELLARFDAGVEIAIRRTEPPNARND